MEDFTLLTPENVELRYDVAGVGSRIIAAVIDYTILSIGLLILFIGGSVLAGLTSDARPPAVMRLTEAVGTVVPYLVLALATLLAFFLWWGYFVLFEMLWNGQSIGKRLLGLRVVQAGGQPIGLGASLVRNLLRAIDVFLWIGVVIMLVDRQTRRLGDFAAGSLVVREPRKLTLDERGVAAPVPVPDAPPERVDSFPNADRLTAAQYTLLRDFFRRRDRLSKGAADDLASRLAADLAAALNVPAEIGDPTAFLAAAIRAYEARHRF